MPGNTLLLGMQNRGHISCQKKLIQLQSLGNGIEHILKHRIWSKSSQTYMHNIKLKGEMHRPYLSLQISLAPGAEGSPAAGGMRRCGSHYIWSNTTTTTTANLLPYISQSRTQ